MAAGARATRRSRRVFPPHVVPFVRDLLEDACARVAVGEAEQAVCRLLYLLYELGQAQRAAGRRVRGYLTPGRLADVDTDLRNALLAFERGEDDAMGRAAGRALGALLALLHPESLDDPDVFPPTLQ
jgi:hypothetical protein